MRPNTRAQVRSVAYVLCAALTIVTAEAFAAVGRTATSANVSSSGESSYSIPIIVPPGTRGMTPQMAFVYSHRNSSTLLGAGWSIAGLSAISRCQQT